MEVKLYVKGYILKQLDVMDFHREFEALVAKYDLSYTDASWWDDKGWDFRYPKSPTKS